MIPRTRRPSLTTLGSFALLAAVALAFLATAPPAVAQAGVDSAQVIGVDAAQAPPQVIDLKALVTDLDTGTTERYSIQPADHVPLTVGDRVRVEIEGTVIRDGRGVAEVLPADFRIAAGPWRIDLAPADRNAVIVIARQPNSVVVGGSSEGSRSQVGFTVESGYRMKDQMREGRITFDIAPAVEEGGLTASDPRWREAEEIADVLSHVLLDERRELPEYYVERIYVAGGQGIQQVAESLARSAEREGLLRGWTENEVVLHLYRHLLGREGSFDDIYEADPRGVRGNRDLLAERGYGELVGNLVSSAEFQEKHVVAGLEELPLDPAVERSRHRRPLPPYDAGAERQPWEGRYDGPGDERGVPATRPRGDGQ